MPTMESRRHFLTQLGTTGVADLAGLHLGCYEVFGNKDICRVADLKGRAVGVEGPDDRSLLAISVGRAQSYPGHPLGREWIGEHDAASR